MTQVLFLGLSLAFFWIEKLKWGSVKPFNCLPCMCGWFSFIVAWWLKADHFYLYLPAGVFVGSIFSAVKNRYL